MALLGAFIDVRTVAAAATASGTFTHGLPATPDVVFAAAVYATTSLATEFPYFCATMGAASVTYFNRGKVAETFSVVSPVFHSIIR